jgi:hypothetical protein
MAKTKVDTPTQDAEDNALLAVVREIIQQQHDNTESIASALREALKPAVRDAITPEYLADPRNREQKLKKPAFQNSRAVSPHGLSDAVIDKLAALKHGDYMGGFVQVRENKGATYLFYPSRTLAERFEQQKYFTSFSDLVDKLYAEMSARDADDKATQDVLAALKAAQKK